MKRTVVIYGHPHYEISVCNKALLDEFSKELPEVEVVNLAEKYPDYRIDIEKEQQRLLNADTIVLQFPFWWYDAPSIVHRYFEEVLAHGFAYGSKGTALHGKKLIISITAGGGKSDYSKDGYQHYEMNDFLPQFIATANLCGLEIADKLISYGMMVFDPNDTAHNNAVIAGARAHGRKLAVAVKNL